MRLGSQKSVSTYPKTVLPIAASVGGLALFLIIASLLLVYQPIGAKVRGYFYNVDQAPEIGILSSNNKTDVFEKRVNDTDLNRQIVDSSTNKTVDSGTNKTADSGAKKIVDSGTSKTADSGAKKIVDSGCDLYHGKWMHDPSGPIYSNKSCPVLTQMQNCQGNGRPDKDYENYRWRPTKCQLPRFDPIKFLEMMRGKTLAFIGDSVARNQMESLLCILW